MVWRIGQRLALSDQLAWLDAQGFGAVSFHASAGVPGVWQGVDPLALDEHALRVLRSRLAPFARREIHAPFDAVLTPLSTDTALEALAPSLELAREVDASILTVHAIAPQGGQETYAWCEALMRLDRAAAAAGVTVGLENLPREPWFRGPRLPHVGVTLDVGHLYSAQLAGYEAPCRLAETVGALGDALVHLHVHDHDGARDHLQVGTGRIDLADLLLGLTTIRYDGFVCLELDPERTSPQGILRSRDRLREMASRLAQG